VRDILRRRALLFDRCRDRGGDVADALDGLADRLDRTDRLSVAICMLAIWLPISSVAFAVWPARLLTSCATTAKPRPASPARAASIVAFSAKRLVCSAIDVISFTTSPIRAPASESSAIR
jgi:hypothetical protein